MVKVISKLSLDRLERSDASVAKVWRWMEANPSSTPDQILSGVGVTKSCCHRCLKRLVSTGWATRTKYPLGRTFHYLVSREGREETSDPIGLRLGVLKKRLTGVSMAAREARYSGLAMTMGQALAQIEKDIVEIRDELYVGK
jgi:predicted transcriptional regulator